MVSRSRERAGGIPLLFRAPRSYGGFILGSHSVSDTQIYYNNGSIRLWECCSDGVFSKESASLSQGDRPRTLWQYPAVSHRGPWAVPWARSAKLPQYIKGHEKRLARNQLTALWLQEAFLEHLWLGPNPHPYPPQVSSSLNHTYSPLLYWLLKTSPDARMYVARWVECLPSIHSAMGSIHNTT